MRSSVVSDVTIRGIFSAFAQWSIGRFVLDSQIRSILSCIVLQARTSSGVNVSALEKSAGATANVMDTLTQADAAWAPGELDIEQATAMDASMTLIFLSTTLAPAASLPL